MILLGCCLLGQAPSWLQAAEWSAPLRDGGEVTVDPSTNRAMIRRGGVETQLWDGVHRLQDGSIITIHSGQVVPNKEILRSRREPDMPEPVEPTAAETWVGAPIVGYSPCERLERRVCGDKQMCAGQEGCVAAQQLLAMEQQERAANTSPNQMTYSSGQCQEADRDRRFFVSCGMQPAPSPAPTAQTTPPRGITLCQMLVNKVCGEQGACSGGTACDAARQLLHMAREEPGRQMDAAVAQEAASETQCREALNDEGFFQRCAQ